MVPYTKFLVFMIKIMRSLIYHEGITSSSCCDRRPHSFTKYWRFLAKKSRTFWRLISGPFERGCWTRFKLSKTLEEFWNLIYEVQKEYYSGPYPHPLKKKKGPVIKQKLQSFLINPLREINFPCSSIGTFEEVARLQNEGIKWLE